MIDFILLSLPVFAIVVIGWAAAKMGIASPMALDALGAFSFRFALPALVIRLIASEPLGRSFDLPFFAGYLASGGMIFALMFGVSYWLGLRSLPAASARATSATVSNLGFLGPPLVLAFLGQRGAGPLAMAIIAEVGILMPFGAVIMAESDRSGGVGRALIRSTACNPIIVAIVAGAFISAMGWTLPTPIDRFLTLLGGSAAPTALFAVGGALAVQRINRSTGLAAASISLVKLILYPLMMWCLLSQIMKLDAFWSSAGVLIASLPSAGSNYVLAQRYAADAEEVSAAIVLSTVGSVLTVPFIAWLVSTS